MKHEIKYLLIPLVIIFITSCSHQTKKLQKQTEKTSPVYNEEIKQDTDVDYDKPAPPLTPEERQRLIDSTEKEDKEDKK